MENKKKKKIFIGLLLMVLLLMPLMGNIGDSQVKNEISTIEPINGFKIAANPSVGTAAICTNPDDTDNMYGGNYKTYLITANITDSDQASDIANVTIIFRAITEMVSMQWINTTNAWAELAGTSAITTFIGTGTNTTHANQMNITLSMQWDWTFPDTDDIDIIIQIYATDGTEVNDTANVNYEVDTDLTVASTELFVDANVQENDNLLLNTMKYSYEDSGGDNYPLAAETDFYITRTAGSGANIYPAVSYESASYSDSTGIATWNSPRGTSTGNEHTETWTILAVDNGDGASGTTLMTSTKTDTVIINSGAGGGGSVDDGLPDIISDNTGIIMVVIIGGGIVAFMFFDGFGSKGKGKGSKKPKRKSKKRKAKPKKRKKR